MRKWFNEKEQTQSIEVILDTIIYKYKTNHNVGHKSQYYQRLVFNTDDLMSLIFQFVQLSEYYLWLRSILMKIGLNM